MSDPCRDAEASALQPSPETETWSSKVQGRPSPSTSVAEPVSNAAAAGFATEYPPGTSGQAMASWPMVPGFEILGVLGRGGMGVVYKAHHLQLKRLVALKMIRPGLHAGADVLARFRVEAEAVARLQHPGIVQIFEIGEHQQCPFFAMELVEGVSLDKLIAGEPVPGRPAAALVQQLALAMQAAHQRNVIHRDLKPANILLQESGGRNPESGKRGQTPADSCRLSPESWIPKIADFGLAKRLDVDVGQTQSGAILGTPNYMAPEQAAGDTRLIGPASDVYALGAILYELLTGRPPFKAASLADTLRQVREEEPVPPSRLEPTTPRDLQTVCLKCLRKAPAQRYGSAADLADDLRRFLAGEPIRARPVGNAERLWRWGRRHPVISVSTVLALVGIVASLWIWQAGESRRLDEESRRVHEEQLRQQAEWRELQEAEAFREKLRLASEADEQLGLGELRAGRTESALKILQTALARLPDEPAFASLRDGLDRRRQRIGRLVHFHQLSTQAEEAVAERFRDKAGDAEALAKCKTALEALGVFEHADWWLHLPDQDLSEPLRRQLRDDAYRELHLLAALQCKSGISDFFGGPAGASGLKESLATVAMVHRYRPSYSASLVEMFCHFRLGQVGKIKPLAGRQPVDAADAHFTGLLYVWLSWGYADSITTVAKFGAALMGLETDNPAAAGERFLRMAANLEPAQYWTNYWLGEALIKNGKPSEAELAFNQCVALRPTYSVGYGGRDHALQLQYRRAQDESVKKAVMQRRLTNGDEAIAHNPRPQFYLTRSKAHTDNNDLDRAIADLDKALELSPTIQLFEGDTYTLKHFQAEVHIERGLAHAGKKTLDQAIADYNQAIALDPKGARAFNCRGLAFLDTKEYDRAIADFSSAIKRDPKFAWAYCNRGRARSHMSDYDQAIADFTETIRLNAKLAFAWHSRGFAWEKKGNHDQAIADFSEAIRLDPRDAGSYIDRGLAFLDMKNHDKAIADFGEAIRLEPKNAFAHNDRGRAWLAKSNNDEAIADFTEAIRLDPKFFWPHQNRGLAWANKGELDKAIADFTAAIALDPKNVWPYRNRSQAWLARKDYDKAIADYTAVIAIDPEDATTLADRGLAWLFKKDYDKSIADFDQVLRLNPKAAWAHNDRGRAWGSKQDYARAIVDFTEAIRLDPKYSVAYYNRGATRSQTKDYKQAIADYDEAIRLNPAYLKAYNQQAWLLATCPDAECRDGKKAVARAKKALELEKNNAAILDTLAAAHAEAGDFEEAIRVQEQALQDPRLAKNELARARLELYRQKKAYRQQ